MKTDKLFYRIFLSQPDLISELLPGVPPDCEFEYSAPVVKEIEVRLDGLLIPSSDDLSLPLVFLEAQMQTDVNFYGRYFAGIYLYLRQYKVNRPWKGLLILNRRSCNWIVKFSVCIWRICSY
jgi:predicted transposase YdaD